MIATKSEMMSRRLSRGWNKPISMTKRQRLKEDREMHGRTMTLQKVHLCTCFYCVNVIIISKSRQRMKKVVESLSSLTSPSASLRNRHIHRLDTIQQKSLLNSPGPFFKHMITTVDLSLAFSFFVMLIRALQPILSYSHQGRKALGKALGKPPPKVPPTTPNADAASFSFSASSLAFSSAFFFFLCNFMCTSPYRQMDISKSLVSDWHSFPPKKSDRKPAHEGAGVP